ncbi:unnamed protein product [Trichogramma brassicae]|uniref:Endonuclease/exonuclease/phosphatase domain-containing protein n=1 Tax=Trichogramma brassicae TaxID=86971 RepID=A0A6H5IST9_9HYME|nr:unnamed protein product [Trichogramma brassicae]
MLLDAISPLDVLLLNTGSRPTFVGSQRGSVIDLIFASDAYTGSDHRAIVFEVLPAGKPTLQPWSGEPSQVECPHDGLQILMSALTRVCDASMLRGVGLLVDRGHHRVSAGIPAGTEIRSASARSCQEDFAVSRRNLHVAIRASMWCCWKQLFDEADRDVCGKPYRTVMSCLKGPRGVSPGEPELVRRAVSTLFPRVATHWIHLPAQTYEERIPEVSVAELCGAYRRVRDQAALGPDGIPNFVLKAAVGACMDVLYGWIFSGALEASKARLDAKTKQACLRALVVPPALHAGHRGQAPGKDHHG